MKLSVIILAAGHGKRMYSDLPKVLHPLAGKSLLERVVTTANQLNPHAIYIVYSDNLTSYLTQLNHWPVQWVKQDKQLGTGHAVLQSLPQIPDDHQILVLYGDVPLITVPTIQSLLNQIDKNGVGLLTAILENPQGFGRIIRASQHVMSIIEDKDANEQQRQIKEINTGVMTAPANRLKTWLPALKNHNAQQEYYLTDIITMAVKEKLAVKGIMVEQVEEVQGINTPAELIRLERYYQTYQAQQLLAQGVIIRDPARFDLRGEIVCGRDVIIDVNVMLEGRIMIGNHCVIEPNVILRNVTVGDNVTIKANCVIEDSVIEADCQIGPFARLRPGTYLSSHVQVGNFIEIKNSKLGEYAKAHHLGYLGDAVIGRYVNVGAGTITCNYDGACKHTTTIGDYSFIGSGTELVAPVTVGEHAYIGAGSTITQDVPSHQLTLARARQVTIKNWQPPVKNNNKKK